MKHFILLFSTAIFFSLFLPSCSLSKSEDKVALMVDVEFSGNLAMLSSDTLYLRNRLAGSNTFQLGAVIFEGEVKFRADTVIAPGFLTLEGRNDSNELRPICSFYYENEPVKIEVDMKDPQPDVVVHGGISSSLFQRRLDFSDSLRRVYRVDSIRDAYRAHKSILAKERINVLYDTLNYMVRDYSCSLAEKNPTALYAMEVFCMEWTNIPLERSLQMMKALEATGKFSNSEKFNDVASKLKRIVERRAQDSLNVTDSFGEQPRSKVLPR